MSCRKSPKGSEMASLSGKRESETNTYDEAKFKEEFSYLLGGESQGLSEDFNLPSDKPEWFDKDLLAKGQEFAKKYYAAVCLNQMYGLILLNSFINNIKPLIFTRNSVTVMKAFKRYAATVLIVKSWYTGDLWDPKSEANKNLLLVRRYHLKVSRAMNAMTPEEIEQKSKLCNILGRNQINSPLYLHVKEEFNGMFSHSLAESLKNPLFFNQLEMSLTIFGFMGLLTVHPEKFGIAGENEGFEGFVHLWRVIGYMLGVEDKYNLCNGSFEEVRGRCQNLMTTFFIPQMEMVNEEWEHISRCILGGINKVINGFSFGVVLLHILWILGIDGDKLKKRVSWVEVLLFHVAKRLMPMGYIFFPIRIIFNNYLIMRFFIYEKYQKQLN